MSTLRICCCFLILGTILFGFGVSIDESICRQTLDDKYVKRITWDYLRDCLTILSGQQMSKETAENIWRLLKLAFENVGHISSGAYKYMGTSLTAIPMDDLQNINMKDVEIVEAFGLIRSTEDNPDVGFNHEQLTILARKVRQEWTGKGPDTYSEYDLKAMGEILCYFNASDLEEIHAIAFKEAVEWIGSIERCPLNALRSFAKLAKQTDAFGEPYQWSTLEVSIIGNILNGLKSNEINSIEKSKLQLNNFYRKKAMESMNSTESTGNTNGTQQQQ